MKSTFIAAGVAVLMASGANAANLDFLDFANNNEHGVANGTVINFDGVDVTFDAGISSTGAEAFSYFDHGGAGLGVCKSPRDGVTFGGGLTGQGTGNDCFNAGDDNVTSDEYVTISFDGIFTLSELSFTGEGHSFSNPVFLQDEDPGRADATLLFGINGGDLEQFTFADLATLSFDDVFSATFAFDDEYETADQFYLASAVLAPIPLPAGLPMLLAGLGGFGFLARRRKNA